MLALPLTSSFSLSSVPWDYVSGCSNCSSSQGPAVAWHTLSPLNTSSLLVFGGDLGPNSLITQPEQSDTAALVNIASITKPVWSTEVSLISANYRFHLTGQEAILDQFAPCPVASSDLQHRSNSRNTCKLSHCRCARLVSHRVVV
ncbi:uncharacterized protein C8Q71DRAFT_780998 [Rhodofomes roseus]|uniref:Uncharacterized protein n=1 Tax=Rhodofomes roseus TaxID=34475 RepID=A0ABQ8K3P9_9APHY|nr:uncharacterized protein C8Q71DRAFT_780998 [Rhodofomes roseus]KAH9831527.1 hypothetical protein C8Q71DRAFT_780998 [Rhodofomes roseus]